MHKTVVDRQKERDLADGGLLKIPQSRNFSVNELCRV